MVYYQRNTRSVHLYLGYDASNDLVAALTTVVDRHSNAPLFLSSSTTTIVVVVVAFIFPACHVCDGGVDAFAHVQLQVREKDEAAPSETTSLPLSFAKQTQLAA